MCAAFHVVHVSSEVYPYSRTGGLADVLGALPQAQAGLGLSVSTLSPWYLELAGEPDEIVRGDGWRLGELVEGGVRQLFLETPGFDRPGLYGPDDVWRFSSWGRAVLPALREAGAWPQVLHGHDWAAGLPVFLARNAHVPSVFTIHNLQYQGRWNGAEAMAWTGLPGWDYTPEGVEFYGDVNLMKAGLVAASAVTTVSPSYAREILTPEFGEGLDPVLRARGGVTGILNGLDTERWNPATDEHLAAPYSNATGKAPNRAALRAEFGLDKAPVLACVSRLVVQKGLDVLLAVLPRVLEQWNVVLLGSGDPALEAAFSDFQGHPRFRYVQGLQEALSHRIYAGADAFVMPSRFEPCGLSQMIALRYGTPVIAHATGGLRDTVTDEVGFPFEPLDPATLLHALARARAAYAQYGSWLARVKRGMQLDFSWPVHARQYLDLYTRLRG